MQESTQKMDFAKAELHFLQAQQVTQEAQKNLFRRIAEEHFREQEETEKLNREEFENFNFQWDTRMEKLNSEIAIEIEKMAAIHELQMNQLQQYLETSYSMKFKPSSELLNLRRIRDSLSK
mmetsp:Transcript_15367/g.23656  ORF Transcript_15367/g.23656 Transcript_15367/m.23656 type:complete len:121 (-) Transcript_15367:326-688(-)